MNSHLRSRTWTNVHVHMYVHYSMYEYKLKRNIAKRKKLRSETTKHGRMFRFDSKWSEKLEAKRNKLRSETLQNYPMFCFALNISETIEAKQSETSEIFQIFLLAKQAKHMRNRSSFALFRFEAKLFFKAKPAHPSRLSSVGCWLSVSVVDQNFDCRCPALELTYITF